MPTKAEPLPFSRRVQTVGLHAAIALRLVPDAAERAGIARLAGLESVGSFVAELTLTPAADGTFRAAGRVHADLRPVCVVTLEPFDQTIDTEVEARFAAPELIAKFTKAAEAEENEDFEPPDELVEGMADLGALAVEFLILALDPYPRKPDAVFTPLEEEKPASPFAKLKALKLGGDDR